MSFAEEGTRKKNLGGVKSKYVADKGWSDKKAESEGFKAKFGLLLLRWELLWEGLLLKEGNLDAVSVEDGVGVICMSRLHACAQQLSRVLGCVARRIEEDVAWLDCLV
jgi:hypothetical protein